MTTLIAVYDSDGCRGRCDARCHDAVRPTCECICGGRNHGVGLARAARNVERDLDLIVHDLEGEGLRTLFNLMLLSPEVRDVPKTES